jgi:translation elongation factor EF-4
LQTHLPNLLPWCHGAQPISIMEPTVTATMVLPSDYVGKVMDLCQGRRGDMLEHSHLGGDRILLRYTLPLAELASDFYGELKSRTQG